MGGVEMRKTITIGDLGEVITGKTPLKTNKNYYGDYALFIKPTDISEDRKYTYETEDMYSQLAAETYKTSLIPKGSICVPCIGTIGTKMTMSPCDCYTNQSINTIVCNERYDNEYVYYLIKNFLPSLKSYNLGTASGREYVSKSNFEMIEIDAEQDLTKQKRIGAILSRYDTLIENYQKQIKLLEEVAQRLYKEWFVDLRFPGHEKVKVVDGVPEGWERKKLGDLFSFVRGKSYTSKELSDSGVLLVNLKNIQAFGGYKRDAEKRFTGQYKPEQRLQKGDLVMGVTDMTQERRLVGHVALIPSLNEDATYSMDLIKINTKGLPNPYLYSAMRFGGISNQISPLANGVNVLHLKPEAMLDIEMIIPTGDIVFSFSKIVSLSFDKIDCLQSQIRLLGESRDRMLVKLMSGEIEV
ncbi:MAG: restriction endonuclease subunit S [Bacteroidales bacterium]|nr:restriction endonuclease subunit S [Bacteroidales bacterium]